MGLPDTYKMPKNYNIAYKVAGDGVVVPIVSYLDVLCDLDLKRALDAYFERFVSYHKMFL